MTCFSCLFGDVCLHFFFVGTSGCPSVILSENRAAAMKVPSCHFSRFRVFHENVDFHRSHFYSEFLANIKNFTFSCFFLNCSPAHLYSEFPIENQNSWKKGYKKVVRGPSRDSQIGGQNPPKIYKTST